MVIIDEPYVSKQMLEWLERSAQPVLESPFARAAARGWSVRFVDGAEAVRRIDAGERLYTNSENALAWVERHVSNADVLHAIAVCKDKAAMRAALAAAGEPMFFKKCSADELANLDFEALPKPFVLKPSVGFLSMGVYVIEDERQWRAALADVDASARRWAECYPDSVIGSGEFLLEEYLDGQEYAVDAFYDEAGEVHVLNVLRHDFSSAGDTSDKLYMTSRAIVGEALGVLSPWLQKAGMALGLRSFPVHVELRVKDGAVRPIEFNPLRFAGFCGTDVACYAFGFQTYAAYFGEEQPDFSAGDGATYTMSMLSAPDTESAKREFDYEAFTSKFSDVCEMRRFDAAATGSFGYAFLRVAEGRECELDYIRDVDLHEFLK